MPSLNRTVPLGTWTSPKSQPRVPHRPAPPSWLVLGGSHPSRTARWGCWKGQLVGLVSLTGVGPHLSRTTRVLHHARCAAATPRHRAQLRVPPAAPHAAVPRSPPRCRGAREGSSGGGMAPTHGHGGLCPPHPAAPSLDGQSGEGERGWGGVTHPGDDEKELRFRSSALRLSPLSATAAG